MLNKYKNYDISNVLNAIIKMDQMEILSIFSNIQTIPAWNSKIPAELAKQHIYKRVCVVLDYYGEPSLEHTDFTQCIHSNKMNYRVSKIEKLGFEVLNKGCCNYSYCFLEDPLLKEERKRKFELEKKRKKEEKLISRPLYKYVSINPEGFENIIDPKSMKIKYMERKREKNRKEKEKKRSVKNIKKSRKK